MGTYRIRLVGFRSLHAFPDSFGEHRGIINGCTLTSKTSKSEPEWRRLLLEAWLTTLFDFPYLQVDCKWDTSGERPITVCSYHPPATLSEARQRADSHLKGHAWPQSNFTPFLCCENGGARLSDDAPASLHYFVKPGGQQVALCMVWEHCLGDTYGGMRVLNQIAEQVARQQSARIELGAEIERLPLSVPAYAGTRIDGEALSAEASAALRTLLEQDAKLSSYKTMMLPTKDSPDSPSFRLHDRRATLSTEQTAQFLRNVKADGTKVGRVLIGITSVVATYHAARRADNEERTHLLVTTATSLRHHLPDEAAQRQIGMCMFPRFPLLRQPKDEMLELHAHAALRPRDYCATETDRLLKEWHDSTIFPIIDEELAYATTVKQSGIATSFIGPLDGVLKAEHGDITISEPELGPLTSHPCFATSCWSYGGRLTLRFFASAHLFDEDVVDAVWQDYLDRVLALAG